MARVSAAEQNAALQTVYAGISPWFADSFTQATLDKHFAIYAALTRVLLNVDPGSARSIWAYANEGNVSRTERDLRATSSMLQSWNYVPQKYIFACGAWGPFGFSADWQVRVDASSPGQERLEVIDARTLGGHLPNLELLTRVRSTLLSELAQPTVQLERRAGPPASSLLQLIPDFPDKASSPFHNDLLPPLPPDWPGLATVELPDVNVDSVTCPDVLPLLPMTGGRVGWSLRFGREDSDAMLALDARPGGGSRLSFESSDESPADAYRSWLTTVAVLRRLRFDWTDTHPEAHGALDAWLRAQLAYYDQFGRSDSERYWDGQSRPSLPTERGQLVPLQMIVRTRYARPELLIPLAAGSLHSYERFAVSVAMRKSPLVATRSPHVWPVKVPTSRPSCLSVAEALSGDGGGVEAFTDHRSGDSIVVSEEAVGHRDRLPRGRHLPWRRRDLRRDPQDREEDRRTRRGRRGPGRARP